jgi:hypothetical protein
MREPQFPLRGVLLEITSIISLPLLARFTITWIFIAHNAVSGKFSSDAPQKGDAGFQASPFGRKKRMIW